MNRAYLLWAPPFDNASGGIIALHRLAVELQKRGMTVFINTAVQNQHWGKIRVMQNPELWGVGGPWDYIAIYPEIIQGSPFNTRTVVRWLLNVPGACSPDYSSTWGANDLFYTYSRLFNTKLKLPESQILLCPHIDLDVFYDQHLPRMGRMKYRGKGQQPDDPRLSGYPLLGQKESFRGDQGQAMLAEALNRCELLFIYDSATAMTELARLCGTPVVLIPDGSYTKEDYQHHEFWDCGGIGWGVEEAAIARATINSDRMWAFYKAAEVEFQRSLTLFIDTTQKG